LQTDSNIIRDHFSPPDLAGIFKSLAAAATSGSDWAKLTLEGLRKCSPLSLAISDRHIRAARGQDIRTTLITDYRLAVRCLENHDFAEGVRAVLRDKDRRPQWRPASFEAVSTEVVDAYFATLGDDDLVLPSRVEMQASRV
jgi:enoyl-CoA hydratase